MTVLLTGCGGKNAEVKYTVDEMLRTPYRAECTARIKTDKTDNLYSYLCTRLENGTYTVDYGDMKITADDNGAAVSGHGMEKITDAAEGVMPLIPTYFFENYLKDGSIDETESGYALKSDISDENPYRSHAEMMTDKNLVPLTMRIFDKDGNSVIEVNIKNFTQH